MGTLCGALIGGVLTAAAGSAFADLDQALRSLVGDFGAGGLVSAGIGLGILFGSMVGLAVSVVWGLIGAGIATVVHTRMPAGPAALLAAGIPSLLFGVQFTRMIFDDLDTLRGPLTGVALSAGVMFVALLPIMFGAIRRSQRAARGHA